jgi:glucose/arabinose dehydrogenase
MKTRNVTVFCLTVVVMVSLATGASAAQPQPQASIPPNVILQPVISGLTEPVFATSAGDGSGRFFIVQKTGQILILKGRNLNATPFLDVSSIVKTAGGEQGLLGLAFDPHYATNGYFYIAYTNQSTVGDDVLARYKVSSGNPDVANPSSAQILLTVSEPEQNHNGGMIAFGPDGYLYFGLGDGGGGGDNHGTIGNGQDKTTLLGKILRLDVSTVPYTVPPTNPFYNSATAKKEIWAYGVRNPWRFSFDKSTGDLYIGDVGQDTQEEIDFQPSGSAGGQNYGWRIREGNLCYNPPTGCVSPPAYVAPVVVYNHGANDSIGCAVTGGYVYRGSAFPGLVGVYLYGDYCSGNLWGLYKNASNQWVTKLIKSTGYNISSFAQDEQGELYILDYGGQLIHITQAPIVTATFTSNPRLDGYIVETSETSGLGGAINATSPLLAVGDTAADQQVRAILSFNTSSLPNNAVITSARFRIKKFSFTGGNPFASLGALVADVGTPVFSGNAVLQSSDFQAVAGYNSCARFSNLPVANWYSAAMVQPSLSMISLTGNTQFRLRFTLEDNNNRANDRVNFLSGNAAMDKPQLIINYYAP